MIIHVFLKTQSGPVCLDSFLQEVYKLVGPSKNQNNWSLNVNAINSHILVCFHNNDRKRVFSNKIVKIFWPVMSAELCWPVKAAFVPVCKPVSQAAS